MHTQKASAKVVGLVVKLCAFAKGGETRVSGEESSFERSRDVGRRVKESESREKGGDFTGGGEKAMEERRRIVVLDSSPARACVRNAFIRNAFRHRSIFSFLPLRLRNVARAQLWNVRRSEEWILSMKRFLLRDEEKNSIF